MRPTLESLAGNYQWYKARKPEFATDQRIPFRVSPTPLTLSGDQELELQAIGSEITQYIHAVQELYGNEIEVRNILNTGKPEVLLADKEPKYVFVRPDIIITPSGFSICEIETSPFGLALAELLNRAYTQEGFETLVGDTTLTTHIQSSTPTEGTLVYSNKTSSYSGQIHFLSDQVFSGNGRSWKATVAEAAVQNDPGNVYRAFYQSEYVSDPSVHALVDTFLNGSYSTILPSLTPHLEEKAILALLWDRRWEHFLQSQLGSGAFTHLRRVVPPTWIVGQERYFVLGLPDGVSSSIDLASLSRSKRTLVIKPSGFSQESSWSEGVNFLHEKSAERVRTIIQQAQDSTSTLHVIQQFNKGLQIPMEYETEDGSTKPMVARVRLTPYYSMTGNTEGQLIGIKATGCENTDFIHASSTSINIAVAKGK